jgi:hypothetical protein
MLPGDMPADNPAMIAGPLRVKPHVRDVFENYGTSNEWVTNHCELAR